MDTTAGMTPCSMLSPSLRAAILREVSLRLQRPAALRHRDPQQDTPDLVHEVVIALLAGDARELRRWDPGRGRSLESFVRLVARRRVARVLTTVRGNPWVEPHTLVEPDVGSDELLRLESRDRLRRVLRALFDEIGPRDRQLFHALFVEERDRDQVASELGMTRAAVDAWCYRMRRRARRAADQLDVTDD